MSNGKRWEIYVCDHCGRDVNDNWRCNHGMCADGPDGGRVEPSNTMVEVLPTAEHNADLESLAQELEERAGAEQELRDKALRYAPGNPIDAVGGAVHATARDALREVAQLVRAEIEAGGK